LADSIDPNSREGGGNGFVFEDYNPAAMLDTIRQAVELFGCRDEWQALMRRGMNADHSWRRATEKYLELFRKLLHNTT
jgi:starch synthase